MEHWTGAVPTIPASFVDPVAIDLALLLWVRHGSLTVGREGQPDLRATAGQAIWIPPGLRHTNATEPGSVVLPVAIEVDGGRDPLPEIAVLKVPPEWSDWLAYRTSRSLGFAAGAEPDRTRVLDLLSGIAPVDDPAPRLPRLPASPGPRAVIERLLREPSTSESLEDLAAHAAVSPRTLQRRLREETGHGFGHWRTAIRIDAAAAHLTRGSDLAWTAHQVGYESVSGFAHAFARRIGTSPGRYARERRSEKRADDPLAGLVAGPEPTPPPPVPGDGPTTWVAQFDGIRWVYRGTATVELGGTRHELRAGDVFWVGRGIAFSLEIAPGSIVLPLGLRSDGRPVRGSLRILRMPQREDVELFLLHTAVANHFLLRPRGHDPRAFLDVLRPDYAVPETLPEDIETIVDLVVGDPADQRSLEDWAAKLARDATELRKEFVEVMGDTYPRWRANVRMSAARDLMWDGYAPSVVARRLGYRHLSGFSRAFSAAHGMSAREWLRRSSD